MRIQLRQTCTCLDVDIDTPDQLDEADYFIMRTAMRQKAQVKRNLKKGVFLFRLTIKFNGKTRESFHRQELLQHREGLAHLMKSIKKEIVGSF